MFKKLKWFFIYRKILKSNRELLFNKHNLKFDWVYRLYKTYTLTDDDLEEIKVYGGRYINNLIEKDKTKIENTLLELGIAELVALIELEKLNERQIGLAFRYKYFDTAKISSISLWVLFTILTTLSFYLVNYEIKSIYFGLITSLVIYLLSRLFKVSRIDK